MSKRKLKIFWMINKDKLKDLYIKAEKGDVESKQVLKEVLRPLKTDSVSQILEKMQYFTRIFFVASLTYKDSYHHREIDLRYAEQIHSFLNFGKPKYKGIIIYGYRESAKTARVMFNDVYLTCYLSDHIDSSSTISEDGGKADEYNMGIFNILAFSSVSKYFEDIISLDFKKTNKKESQTMSKFTTTNGVTYNSTAARKSKRGAVKVDISKDGGVETKRPTKLTFDDIENEVTILSLAETGKIRQVMNSSIAGMNQTKGFWVLLGNFLSLRGNVAYYINKHQDDPRVAIIDIPIKDSNGNPTWEDKYVLTDKEELELSEQGITKVSIETIERNSDNFETEFMNKPSRNLVYFDDRALAGLNDENLVPESARDSLGYLEIEDAIIHCVYIISVDSAKGVGKDESSFTVIKTTGEKYEEVANFKSKTIKPENYAPFLVSIARKYNNALIIPENNYPGNETIAFLKPIYNNIYFELDNSGNKEYGVNTNVKTKPEMLLRTKKILIDKLFTVRSRALFSQIIEFPSIEVYSLKQRDGSGGHFDLLMSCIIGLWKANTISADYKENDQVQKTIKRINQNIYDDSDNHNR
jgi:hypothetical protein